MLRNLLMTSVAIFALQTTALHAQQTTQWSNATAAGNGCPAGSSTVIITPGGDEIAWIFDKFGFELTAPSSSTRFCRLSASAKIAAGFYLAELKQELTYSGTKSKNGSRLKIGASSRFFGYDLPEVSRTYAEGTDWFSTSEELSSTNDFLVFAPPSHFCSGNPNRNGLFQSTLSATGQVFPNGGSAALSVQGQNVTFRAKAGWVPCPPS